MSIRDVVVTRTRAGVIISAVVITAVATGAAPFIKGFGSPDHKPPVVRIDAPLASQGIFGDYTLSATCKDNVGCTGVTFSLDGTPVGTATQAPFEVNVDTSGLGNGNVTVSAVATDAASNTTTATPHIAQVVNGLGKVFVSATGSDSGVNCRHYTDFSAFPADPTTVCATFIKANYLAQSGDVVLVGDGSYAAQKVCGGPVDFVDHNCIGTPNEGVEARTGSAPVTFLGTSQHGATVAGLLDVAQNNGSLPPNHIAFDGIDVKGQVVINNPQLPGFFTFSNMHVYNIANQSIPSNGAFVLGGAHNVTIKDSEIGPLCCDMDGVQTSQVVNFLFQDNLDHDLYDSCRWVPAAIISDLGACSAIGFGDDGHSDLTLNGNIDNSQTTITASGTGTINTGWGHPYVVRVGSEDMNVTAGFGTTTWTVTRGYNSTTPASHLSGAAITYINNGYDHVDGMDMWAGVNTQVLRNQFWGIGANGDPVGQTMFMSEDPIGACLYFDGVHIVNNSIMVGNTDNNTITLIRGGGSVGCTPLIKNVYILYNTVMNTRSDFSGGNIEVGNVDPSTPLDIVGNIIRAYLGFGSVPPCGSGTNNVLLSHNFGVNGTCVPTDLTGTINFVNADPLGPDMHLVANGQAALAGGENTYCPATDVLGNPRPTNTPCSMGAYQG